MTDNKKKKSISALIRILELNGRITRKIIPDVSKHAETRWIAKFVAHPALIVTDVDFHKKRVNLHNSLSLGTDTCAHKEGKFNK